MKMTNKARLLSLILCMVLTWTAALITGCTTDTTETPSGGTFVIPVVGTAGTAATTEAPTDGVTELGEGSTVFDFTVVAKDGAEKKYRIKTDKTIVGEALSELGLIEGEEGPYGLYVKKVNGILADYDTDGTYWAFYVNGEYGMTGVDKTDIVDDASYAFKVEK